MVKQLHELSVCALQRSGHHAIMEWLRSMLSKKYGADSVVFMNWINEYRIAIDPFNNDPGKSTHPRKALIYNFEDCGLYLPRSANRFAHKFVGESENWFSVLIIRDFYNLMASRMERTRKNNMPFTTPYYPLVDLWLEHASEAAAEETGVGSIFTTIKYNKWFSSEKYRMTTACRLGLPYTDNTIEKISEAGEGSSFIGIHGTARKLDVLNRWKSYRDDEEYIELVTSSGISKFNDLLFGWCLVKENGSLVMKCSDGKVD